MDKVLKNLNREIGRIEGRTRAGLFAAGLKVQRESQKRVPVETGNLKGSAFTRKALADPDTVEIGYEAEYALHVHENMEQKLKGIPRPPRHGRRGIGVYWGPDGRPKYLESAVRDLQGEIVDTVRDHAKVK